MKQGSSSQNASGPKKNPVWNNRFEFYEGAYIEDDERVAKRFIGVILEWNALPVTAGDWLVPKADNSQE